MHTQRAPALARSSSRGRGGAVGEDGGGNGRWSPHACKQPHAGGASGRSSPGDRVGPGMLSFSGSLRVFVAVEACDMRKGFEGLSALVGTVLKEEVKKRGALCL